MPLNATGIGLQIPTTSVAAIRSPLTAQLVHGAEAVARERGLHFYLTRFTDDGGLPPCLNPVEVDGLIIRNLRAR